MRKNVYYYDQLEEDFEAFMSDYDVERRQAVLFSDLVPRDELAGRRVLEVGSGTGRFSRAMVGFGAELTVLDVGPGLVGRVVGGLSCAGVAGDAVRLPFADGSFDAVISSECIEHTVDPVGAIREMCRVCRPGGVVGLTTPNRLWYPVLIVSQKLSIRKFAGIENWIRPRDASTAMQESGMSDVVLSGCHLWPFQLEFTHPFLRRFDAAGRKLYPLMINFGIRGRKRAKDVAKD